MAERRPGYNDKTTSRRRSAAGDNKRDQQAQQDARALEHAQRLDYAARARRESRNNQTRFEAASAANTAEIGGGRAASAQWHKERAVRSNQTVNAMDAKRRKQNTPSDRSAAAKKAWATRRARGRGKA